MRWKLRGYLDNCIRGTAKNASTWHNVLTAVTRSTNIPTDMLCFVKPIVRHLLAEIPPNINDRLFDASQVYIKRVQKMYASLKQPIPQGVIEQYSFVQISKKQTPENDEEQTQRFCMQPTTTIPDCGDYALGVLYLPVHTRDVSTWAPKKRTPITVVKIVKKTGTRHILKFFKPTQINWNRGPTVLSIYAVLDTDTKKIWPILMTFTAMEKMFLDPGYAGERLDSLFQPFAYTSVERGECTICLETTTTMVYGYCDQYHLAVCEDCIHQVTTCPLCQKPFVAYKPVTFL